jgi:gliding motility-associated-like protein
MKKRIFKLSLKALVAFFMLGGGTLYAQTAPNGEELENLYSNWWTEKADLQQKLGLSNLDFNDFIGFYHDKIESAREQFFNKIKNGKVTEANIKGYMAFVESQDIYLYHEFEKVKKDFPSSVSEYSLNTKQPKALATCNPGCTNIDFSNGTLSSWNAYWGINQSGNPGFGTGHVIQIQPGGGPCGSVTGAANSGGTSSTDYQVSIQTAGNDPIAPAISKIYPFGGTKYSARIGDSTANGAKAGILNQTFMVTPANVNLTYEYAVFLENPSPPHGFPYDPFFNAVVLDAKGDTISKCQNYTVASDNAKLKGFDSVFYAGGGDYIYYKNWQTVFTDLTSYIGQCVTIQFTCADCSPGAHCGYAYVSATCSGYGITTSSPAICGQKYITLTAPPGGTQYIWSGPTNGIVGTDTTATIKVDSAGTYKVIIVPVTGKSCADTLSITIKKVPGPPPIPSFTADTVCVGIATQFTNTSNPGAGVGTSFYWDFYNNGTINDSTTSPTWTFSAPGVYSVQLNEVHNGCGMDTIIKIKVDSIPAASFTVKNTCVGQAVTFNNTSTGANSYSWYFGNGSTSSAVSPTYTYPTSGTYTVSLVAGNGHCKDSVSKTITIVAAPKIIVAGTDSVCQGSSTTLTASGAGAYVWQPGNLTGKTVNVSPTVTTTYTVSGTKGGCTGDTTVVVKALPSPTLSLDATPDTICSGSSTALGASGAASYTWSPSSSLSASTGSFVTGTPTVTTKYVVTGTSSGCSSKDSVTVTVFGSGSIAPKITLSRDSLCPGDTLTMTASGAASYVWSTGATTSAVNIGPSPAGTYTYNVVASSKCVATTTVTTTVFVEPVPNASISGKDTICKGGATVLTANFTAGSPGYLWSTGSNSNVISVSPTVQTTYTVTEANGRCAQSATFTVIIRPKPSPIITATPDTVCLGTSASMSAIGASTYVWTPSGSLSSSTGASVTATPTTTTTYTLIGSYSDSGCVATTTKQVVVLSGSITGNVTLSRDSLCPGSELTMKANSTSTGLTYLWSNGSTYDTTTIAPFSTGSIPYYVVLKSKCATDTLKTIVFVEPKPIPVINSSNNLICAGDATTLTASSSVGAPGYLWSAGLGTNNVITVSPTAQTVYTVTAADGNCVAYAYDTVRIKPGPIVVMQPTASVCSGDSLTITATGGGSYKWFNGATGSSITINPTTNTDAWVVVVNGCSTRDSTMVTVNQGPSIKTYGDTTIDLGGTAVIGVVGGVSWKWEPSGNLGNSGAASTTAQPTENTTYTVVAVGSNGCTSQGTVTVDIACEDFTVPNVFTPGLTVGPTTLNDNIFYIKGASGEPNFNIEIFNRWGVSVYKSSDPSQSWDGKDKSGTLVSSGVYYYIIKSTCGSKNYDKHGFVQVIDNK